MSPKTESTGPPAEAAATPAAAASAPSMAGKESGIDTIAFGQAGRIPKHSTPGSKEARPPGLRPGIVFETTLRDFRELDLVVLRVRGNNKPRCEQASSLSWNP